MEMILNKIIIDGELINSERDFHAQIAEQLGVDVFYGRNLDALWDLLSSSIERPVELSWISSQKSVLALGRRFDDIVETLRRVVEQDAQYGWEDRFSFALS